MHKHHQMRESVQMKIPKTTSSTLNYHTSKLQFGFFFLNLNDAIRELDAARLFRCFRFALLVEYNHQYP